MNDPFKGFSPESVRAMRDQLHEAGITDYAEFQRLSSELPPDATLGEVIDHALRKRGKPTPDLLQGVNIGFRTRHIQQPPRLSAKIIATGIFASAFAVMLEHALLQSEPYVDGWDLAGLTVGVGLAASAWAWVFYLCWSGFARAWREVVGGK